MVVIDEADKLVAKWNNHQRKTRAKQNLVDPCVSVLRMIAEETENAGRKHDWQLVAASATVNRRTERNLTYSSGVLLKLLRAEGVKMPKGSASKGQYHDGTTALPDGLKHTLRVVKRFRFNTAVAAAADTIKDLGAQRVLVAIAAEGVIVNKSEFGRNPVTGVLRFRLQQFGYQVSQCSNVVETAAQMWASSPDGKAKRRGSAREVIVGTSEALRGIHLDDVDAVVIIGDPVSIQEYLHCAGRTCRYRPEHGKPTGGSVVTLCPESVADRLIKWGALSGFKIYEVPLEEVHPPVLRRASSFTEEPLVESEDARAEEVPVESQATSVEENPDESFQEEKPDEPAQVSRPPALDIINDDLFAENPSGEDSTLQGTGAWG